jgi:hypothetical protein
MRGTSLVPHHYGAEGDLVSGATKHDRMVANRGRASKQERDTFRYPVRHLGSGDKEQAFLERGYEEQDFRTFSVGSFTASGQPI